jgi:hypothetical protein
MSGRKHHPTGRIFAIPVLIALVTLIGLVAALLGDGWRDMLSWVGLGIPVITALHFALRRAKVGP